MCSTVVNNIYLDNNELVLYFYYSSGKMMNLQAKSSMKFFLLGKIQILLCNQYKFNKDKIHDSYTNTNWMQFIPFKHMCGMIILE